MKGSKFLKKINTQLIKAVEKTVFFMFNSLSHSVVC